MSTLRNKVQLIGRVGQDPEIKVLENNKKLARLSLATNESYSNAKGEKVEETTWHNLVVWGNLSSIVEQHVTKGKQIAVEGKLSYNDFTTKDGIVKHVAEIVVDEIILL